MEPVPLAWSAPFAGLLLGIAVLPLAAAHWWEHNRNKAIVAAVFAVPVALWAFGTMRHDLGHAVLEYVSFLCLLGSLYVANTSRVLNMVQLRLFYRYNLFGGLDGAERTDPETSGELSPAWSMFTGTHVIGADLSLNMFALMEE